MRKLKRDNKDIEACKKNWMNYYHIDSTWFAGAFDNEQMIKDSMTEISMGIVLKDIPNIKPNPRVVIFDACYNGDFREDSFIAGEYIFAAGKTVIGIGNSVNVLQDKSASDMLGLMGLGYSVGEWAQLTNILESHIIGDPTFHFAASPAISEEPFNGRPDMRSNDSAYWLDFFNRQNIRI